MSKGLDPGTAPGSSHPASPPHLRHKITGLQAAGLEPRTTGPLSHPDVVAAPRCSDHSPPPPLWPPWRLPAHRHTLGPTRTLPASLSLDVSPQPTSTGDSTEPQTGHRSSQSWLPAFLHSFTLHSLKPFRSGPGTVLALGVQQRARKPESLPKVLTVYPESVWPFSRLLCDLQVTPSL